MDISRFFMNHCLFKRTTAAALFTVISSYAQATNGVPHFTSTAITTVADNVNYRYTVNASDADGDSLVYSVKAGTSLPSWLSFSTAVNVSTIAGSGTAGFADGTAAQFSSPGGIAVDGAGNVYVADMVNQRIRKITPAGVVSTLAGSGTKGFADGDGTVAQFSSPTDVAVDGAGNVYVADKYNQRIRKITPMGVVSTLAGSIKGNLDGTGTAAKFQNPQALTVDSAGNVYVADRSNHLIRKITPAGVVSTLAGSDKGNINGTGTAAKFNTPAGVAVDGAGNVYVAGRSNHLIRKITPAGVVSTLAGSGTAGFADGDGTAAQFNLPIGVTVDGAGNVYSSDFDGHRIRKITSPKLTGTPSSSDAGDHAVCLVVSDGTSNTEQCFTVTVTLTNADGDGDGVTDSADAFPLDATESVDSDGDGTGNNADTDDDGDGVADSDDDFPLDSNEHTRNKASIADNQSITVDEDTQVSITLTGSNDDGDDLTYTLVSQPSHGKLIGSAPNLTYIPAADYAGSDSFTFKMNDGTVDSATAMVSISVTDVAEPVDNLPPIALDDEFSFYTGEVIVLDVLANDSDPEGDKITLVSATSAFGQVDIVDSQLVFTPDSPISGTFTLKYSVSNSEGNVINAMVTVTITNVEAPVILLPEDLCGEFTVSATALYTRVDLGETSATDRFGNSIPVSLVNAVSVFPPGISQVFWQATDADGNTSIATQLICVLPLISIEINQSILAGESATVGVYLNGESPVYPVVIPYTVSGSATDADHNLVDGEVIITAGTQASIDIKTLINDAASADKNIIISLSNEVNLGAKNSHTLLITEQNIAPEIALTVTQQGQQRLSITPTGGVVTIATTLHDPNLQDNHVYQWQAAELDNLSNDDNTFAFDSVNLAEGLYKVTVTVTDSGSPQGIDIETIYVEVVATLIEFTDKTVDSDGDMIPDYLEGYQDEDNDGIPDYLDSIVECNILPEKVSQQSRYLIEGQVGACLRRGNFTFGGETTGSQITDTDINKTTEDALISDPDAQNVGGIFDYVAYGLPDKGLSFAIVMPQRKPIPMNAVYRKFTAANGWGYFIEDENNSLWSTQGELSYCPPPSTEANNNVWTPGLTEGHYCVQQHIQDGGVNDDDGVANGTIVDPGGVSVMLSNNTLPVAIDDTVSITVNAGITIIDVLSNDGDGDGDVLIISSATTNIGTVSIVNNKLSYESAINYNGDVTINYGISDKNGGSDNAVVRIQFINEAPVVTNEQSKIMQNKSITINLLSNDVDPENDNLILLSVDNDDVTYTAYGASTFRPAINVYGLVTINYLVRDTAGNTVPGQWQVNIIEVVQVKSAVTKGGGSIGVILFFGLLLLSLRNIRVEPTVLNKMLSTKATNKYFLIGTLAEVVHT